MGTLSNLRRNKIENIYINSNNNSNLINGYAEINQKQGIERIDYICSNSCNRRFTIYWACIGLEHPIALTIN
ncbi:MAG: hypothetical protein K0S51_1027 [Bacillales bacterium]|jgi:hypothetical protein|nr:hypothetical protein [Bacillales bacterium]